MAIGERIHHFRLLRGFTQKYLGQQLGFSDSQADVRIAQYEKGARSPKEKYQPMRSDIFLLDCVPLFHTVQCGHQPVNH